MAQCLCTHRYLWRQIIRQQTVRLQWLHSASIHNSCVRPGYEMSGKLRDCYQLLHIDHDADDEEIKMAYVKLAKEYHPDSSSGTPDANKFHQIQEAYRTIRVSFSFILNDYKP